MKLAKSALCLYAVTDRMWSAKEPLLSQIEASLKGGVTCLQLREKDLPFGEFLAEAFEVKALCRKYNVPFIVNDDVEVALQSGADGVHIGQSDISAKQARALLGKDKILGVSAQTVGQALKAAEDGADYLGVGAVFATATKLDADAVSFDTLKAICDAVSIPVIAIGGITKENLSSLRGSGISGVALVSAIYASENIEQTCAELSRLARELVL